MRNGNKRNSFIKYYRTFQADLNSWVDNGSTFKYINKRLQFSFSFNGFLQVFAHIFLI